MATFGTRTAEIEARQHEVGQIGAIAAFEGFQPSPEFASLRDRYSSGEIDVREFKQLVLTRWKRNG